MPDLLIRNLDDEDLRGIDALARRLGISRRELLRREAHNLARRGTVPVTREDLGRSAAVFADALDESVMDNAW